MKCIFLPFQYWCSCISPKKLGFFFPSTGTRCWEAGAGSCPWPPRCLRLARWTGRSSAVVAFASSLPERDTWWGLLQLNKWSVRLGRLPQRRLSYPVFCFVLQPDILAMAHVHRLTPSPALIFTTVIALIVLIPGDFQSIVNYFRWFACVYYLWILQFLEAGEEHWSMDCICLKCLCMAVF